MIENASDDKAHTEEQVAHADDIDRVVALPKCEGEEGEDERQIV